MSKPLKKKSRSSKTALSLRNPINSVTSKSKLKIPLDSDLNKKILVVCEGPTEYSYFEGLCFFYNVRQKNNFKVIVLPESNSQNYKGSSVKGLLYEAMKKNYLDGEYDEVWIVTDNDEENSYKIDANSLDRIKEKVPVAIYDRLSSFKIFTMNVRVEDIKKGEHERNRYFLNRSDYENFLTKNILCAKEELNYLDIIIESTSKSSNFESLYEGDYKSFFYDDVGNFLEENSEGQQTFLEKYFDKNWKKYNVAYTSIAFEYWLLLHFEVNNQKFYNSREIVKVFDDKGYFDISFKENQTNGFVKGYHLYRLLKEDNSQIKSFFSCANRAIFNNLLINNEMQFEIEQGNKFFEINPFSDVFVLTYALLYNFRLKQGFLNRSIDCLLFKDVLIESSIKTIKISFNYFGNSPILKKDLEALFCLYDLKKRSIPIQLDAQCEVIVRKNEKVVIEIIFDKVKDVYFLFFDCNKTNKEGVFWVIQ